ncbi:MAG TPA: hypothetical protein VF719_07160, partial [Abditibacteriaceae bacterium]
MNNFVPYHHAWACFNCRKSFKKAIYPSYRLLQQPVVVCPECKGQMKYMGRKFAAPKQSDVKGWQETRDWLLKKELPKVATMTYEEILQHECVSSYRKLQAKKARQRARHAWVCKKQDRILKNL